MVEQRSPKPTVEGSSPSAPANEKQRPLLGVFLFLGLLWLSFRHFLSSFLLSFCPFLFSSLLFSSLLFLACIVLTAAWLVFACLCCKQVCFLCHQS